MKGKRDLRGGIFKETGTHARHETQGNTAQLPDSVRDWHELQQLYIAAPDPVDTADDVCVSESFLWPWGDVLCPVEYYNANPSRRCRILRVNQVVAANLHAAHPLVQAAYGFTASQ